MSISTPKLVYIVKILNLLNYVHQTNTGALRGVQILTQENQGKKLKNLHLNKYNATICDITMQASSNNVDS